MRWTFTPDEFAHVWRETELDRYPAPLHIIETAPTADAARKLRAELNERLPLRSDPDLSVALRIAATPTSHVKVIADDTFRMLGCAVNATAVVMSQTAPSSTVHISLVTTKALSRVLAQQLPHVPAGKVRQASAPLTDLADGGPLEVLVDPARRPAADPVRAVIAARRTRTGHIGVFTGLDRAHAPKPQYVSWIDVEADGRYLVKSSADVEILSAPAAVVVAELERMLGRTPRT